MNDNDMVLIERRDLHWLIEEVELCDTTDRLARLLAALNGEAVSEIMHKEFMRGFNEGVKDAMGEE